MVDRSLTAVIPATPATPLGRDTAGPSSIRTRLARPLLPAAILLVASSVTLSAQSRTLPAGMGQETTRLTVSKNIDPALIDGIRLCLAGDFSPAFEVAARAVVSLSDDRTRAGLETLPDDLRTRQCVVLLYTRAGMTAALAGDGRHAYQHLNLAVSVAEQTANEPFEQAWHLALTAWLQYHAEVLQAVNYLNRGLNRYPRSAELLAARGMAFEELSFTSAPPPGIAGPYPIGAYDAGHEVRRALERAVKDLQPAADTAPDALETRLHLGRVLSRLGRHDEAAVHIDYVRTRTRDPDLAYLATLFAAADSQARGDAPGAIARYRAALALQPAQSAVVGLADAYAADGQLEEAASTLAAGLPARAEVDPWFTYLLGAGRNYDARIQALLAMVRP